MSEKIFTKEEFIGLNVNIDNCKDPSWIGKTGMVIDETKNTFTLKINGKNKKIGKNISIFKFEYQGNNIILNGSKITYKPEDRIKKTG
jgi:ribonuclease P protein subunit POP4